ncbi:MAG: hypothetical protein EBX59_12610, partial [Betaproteobacteria bacterium]|nr:hypothetical protein [Betaproteobacteria bacterium]
MSGGTAPYTYSWSNSANTSAISSLSAGTYSLTVTDVNGCSNNLASVTITEPTALALTTSSTPASCNPDGSASVSVTGGIGTYTYLWSNGATTASLANLAAGSYAVTVTDGNGCSASSNVIVGSLASLTASASVSSPILCNGGTTTVNITATGGAAPYTGTGSLANVTAGTYTYTVTDVNGCTASTTLTVTEPTPLTVDNQGRVFGHIAAWHVDHIGMAFGTRPPRSRSNYSYFHTGVCRTAEGADIPVGQLTLAGGHADIQASATEAVKHYDDTASAVADVHAGEDQYGIWVAGALRPGV